MKTKVFFCITIMFFLLFSGITMAGEISGTLMDLITEDSLLSDRVNVKLFKNPELVKTFQSTVLYPLKEGDTFVFENLPDGKYVLEIEAQGYHAFSSYHSPPGNYFLEIGDTGSNSGKIFLPLSLRPFDFYVYGGSLNKNSLSKKGGIVTATFLVRNTSSVSQRLIVWNITEVNKQVTEDDYFYSKVQGSSKSFILHKQETKEMSLMIFVPSTASDTATFSVYAHLGNSFWDPVCVPAYIGSFYKGEGPPN